MEGRSGTAGQHVERRPARRSVDYCDYLVDLIATAALDGLRIVLDCANGAMFEAAPEVDPRASEPTWS